MSDRKLRMRVRVRVSDKNLVRVSDRMLYDMRARVSVSDRKLISMNVRFKVNGYWSE
jgi:hypothetical protein